MPITAVARSDLRALAFRDGYAPFAPFSGRLDDERRWAVLNRQRLPLLLQPLGLWGAHEGYNKSEVAVELFDDGAALPNMMRLPLHWIERRTQEQNARPLRAFWNAFMHCEPPVHLYHAQVASLFDCDQPCCSSPPAQ